MPTVSFATHCHPPHLERLHKLGVLSHIVASHEYSFDEVLLVHQQCQGILCREIVELPALRVLESEDWEGPDKDYAPILTVYDIPANDPIAEELTHGPTAAHYYKHHLVNHLIELSECISDYIVFSDCDCLITETPESPSWIEYGISILEERENVFCVSPNDGSSARYTQTMSQQCFLVNTERMRQGPLSLVWDGVFEEGGPFQEYQFMLEGRIGRLLKAKNWYRYVLRKEYRYWHYSNWTRTGWDVP